MIIYIPSSLRHRRGDLILILILRPAILLLPAAQLPGSVRARATPEQILGDRAARPLLLRWRAREPLLHVVEVGVGRQRGYIIVPQSVGAIRAVDASLGLVVKSHGDLEQYSNHLRYRGF